MYVHEHTVGSILRSAFKIYGNNFGTIFITYTLPILPFVILTQEAKVAGNIGLLLMGALGNLVVTIFAYGAITVTVSDICLGNQPGFVRSYKRLFGKLFGSVLFTNILQFLVIMGGLLLLVIPGLVAIIWLLFTPAVVILERTSGISALKRSKSLGDGFHWKNAGVLLLLLAVLYLLALVVGGIFGLLLPGLLDHWSFRAVMAVFQEGLFTPILLIGLVLMYYNLRVRKEGYDSDVLAEELKH